MSYSWVLLALKFALQSQFSVCSFVFIVLQDTTFIIMYPCFLFTVLVVRHLCVHSATGPGGEGVLPYKGLMGTCGQPGYVFRDFCLKQGIEFIIFCLNQGIDLSIFVLNRMSFLGR